MATAKKGDQVQVHYTGRLTDETVFDSSEGREPLGFQVGAGQMIKGFDVAVEGMAIGDKKTVTLAPEEAYGDHRPELIFDVKKADLPADLKPEVGQTLYSQTPQGPQPLKVVEVNDAGIKVDANHALAGKELVFDIELVAIG
ncbi:peptidyl-prolyl cis-trans isomerase [Fulvitalea axinellae]|uniref:Peptidyl-prolyl cis-trans isomerase n=1 Tax=Fulvitalea axinellae TaxID=1182444 RepID=A0AAU9D5V2_9BACT|nr:peptidyl-prolyl cis-trans isomerase [Fulvitalea axinellae]